MTSGFGRVLQKLKTENSPQEFEKASEIILKFANNVISQPDNEKYRRIRVGNPIVMEKLLPVSGAVECLFEIGFQEDDDYFTLPQNVPIANIIQFRDQLQEMCRPKQQIQTNSAKNQQSATASDNLKLQESFLKKVMSTYQHVLIYEDTNLQTKARNIIPIKLLTDKAQKKQSSLSEQVQLQDLILLELLSWFKNNFFKWMDAPKCGNCASATKNVGMTSPTNAEAMWGASRVENYQCNSCKAYTRFPRYNHPGKLLDTRCGRCGEWANCFTLCCRAMGFEARYVLDWTDHVWTEVFSESQNRWMHCDPCENICDKPLVYEVGWKKKLSYIMAFSKDDIQDVTWRYSCNHNEILKRRTEVSESFLLNAINRLRQQKQKDFSEAQKKRMLNRLVVEIVEFMSPKVANEEEQEGRQSGAMAWRLARGETGIGGSKNTNYIFSPTEEEVKNKLIHLKYCCATDSYIRLSQKGTVINKWESMVNEVNSVVRKVEHDWNMSYLARTEGTATASISWKFQFNGCEVEDVEIEALSTCFEDGHVSWRVCAGDVCVMLRKDGRRTKLDDLKGSKEITLTADMSRGKGDLAWQHTQLFRQYNDEIDLYPLEIIIHLK